MSIAKSARIHATAVLSPEVEVGENVEIGALAVLEGNISIGDNCVIRPGAHLFGNLTLGEGNQVFTGVVLGEVPQHLKYNGEPTRLEIGDGNIFREHVTIHRGTAYSGVTRIGSHNFFMACSHVGHDCVIGNRCILANGALVAGHCVLDDNAYMSGNAAIHQFVRIGRLALLSGCSITTKNIPPFIIQQGINNVVGINIVGMRRAGMTAAQISAVHQAFRIIYRDNMMVTAAIDRLDRELGGIDVVQEIICFLRNSPKGINLQRGRRNDEAA
jgi:UDP-N-acetylglucosamine acyltransferase